MTSQTIWGSFSLPSENEVEFARQQIHNRTQEPDHERIGDFDVIPHDRFQEVLQKAPYLLEALIENVQVEASDGITAFRFGVMSTIELLGTIILNRSFDDIVSSNEGF